MLELFAQVYISFLQSVVFYNSRRLSYFSEILHIQGLMGNSYCQTQHVRMVWCTWWEEMMCQEGELSTAIREAGTLCVPVTGMRGGMRLESFALVLDLPLVSSY